MLGVAFVFAGCSGSEDAPEPADSSTRADSTSLDTTEAANDAGADSGALDSSLVDSGAVDSEAADSGSMDAESMDSVSLDSGSVDSGAIDSGPADSGFGESDVADSGAPDSTSADAVSADVGSADVSSLDGAADAALVAGDRCANAAVLVSGTVVTDTTADATNDYGPGSRCVGTSGPDKAWSITLPAGKRMSASVSSASTTFDPAINLVAGPAAACEATPRVCVAGDDSGTLSTTNRVRAVNESSGDQEYFVIVDSSSATGGPFTLEATAETIVAGDTCGTAQALPADGVYGGQSLSGFVNDYAGGVGCPSASSSGGVDRVYAVELAAGKELGVEVSGTGLNLSLVTGPATRCGSTRSCVASDASTAAIKSVRYRNYTGGTQTVFIVVDAPSTGTTSTFSLSATRVDAPLVPAGEVCANASPLLLSTTVTSTLGTLVGYTKDYALSGTVGCKVYSGAEKVYAVTIPAGKKLVATSVPSGGMDTVLNLVLGDAAACVATGTICVAGADASGAAADTLAYTNVTSAPVTGFLIVSSFSSTTAADFSLETQLQ